MRVADLIPGSISCGMLLLWRSARVVECKTSHICHASHKTNYFYSIALFLQDAECSANPQSRQTRENFSRITLTCDNSLPFNFSFSRSLALSLCSLGVSRSLFLSISLCHSTLLSVQLTLSRLSVSLPFFSFALFCSSSKYLSFSTLSLSHTHTNSLT